MNTHPQLRIFSGNAENPVTTFGKYMKPFILAVLITMFMLVSLRPRGEFIPAQANSYRSRLVREAHAGAGLGAPVEMFAAQIHQESDWKETAHSGVGAIGIAQFMPGTAAWTVNLAPADLKPAEPLDADWAMRALVRYDLWIYNRLPQYQAGDERWAAALAGYNGGLGWAQKDARLTGCARWFGCAELAQDGRTQASLTENRGYPERILHLLRPLYLAAGWRERLNLRRAPPHGRAPPAAPPGRATWAARGSRQGFGNCAAPS